MGLAHPAIDTRDTALFLSFRRSLGYRPRVLVPLAELVQRFMGRAIEQHGDIPVSLLPPLSLWLAAVQDVLTEPRAGRTGARRARPLPLVRADLGGHHRHGRVAVCAAP